MNNKIKELLQSLEKEKNIRILFAVENGSRAWRMHSTDSDYDVRFVYVRPLKDYIQINTPKDVITTSFDKEGLPCPQQGCFIDMAGFDVFKYVTLLSRSNPTAIEWLMSDIVYYGEQNKVFKKFAKEQFNPVSLYHHYKSMCKNNYLKYIKSGHHLTYKKYLYAFRGLVNAEYVFLTGKVPPIIFKEAMNMVFNKIPEGIYYKLDEIIRLKRLGLENDIVINREGNLEIYIEHFLEREVKMLNKKLKGSLDVLNEELKRIILNP